MKRLFLVSAVILTGCATAPCVPKIETQTVKVEVQVPCKVDVPSKPRYNSDVLNKTDPMFDKAKAILADRDLDRAYTSQLETALAKCTAK